MDGGKKGFELKVGINAASVVDNLISSLTSVAVSAVLPKNSFSFDSLTSAKYSSRFLEGVTM